MCCDKNLHVRPGQTRERAVRPSCNKKETYEKVGGDEHKGCQSRQPAYSCKPNQTTTTPHPLPSYDCKYVSSMQ
jgi:hypothetical protein